MNFTYLNTTEGTMSAVAEMVRLVKSGEVEPLVAWDTETQPSAGLTHYPGSAFTDSGDRIAPKKKDYLTYSQERWLQSFRPAALAALGLNVPQKTTSGNEMPGVKAGTAWVSFNVLVKRVSDTDLESARWESAESVDAYVAETRTRVSEQQTLIAALSATKGKKAAVEAAKKVVERAEWVLAHIEPAYARLQLPLDLRLLRHIVSVGVEGRIKTDAVRPGLDALTSDLFTVQFSLRRVSDGEVLSWVFNTAKVPADLLRPLFKISRSVVYLAHNAVFDLKLIMSKLGVDAAPRNNFCTRVGSRMLFLGLKSVRHSLKDCAKRFAGVEMQKEIRTTFIGVRRDEPTEEQLAYGVVDAAVLFPVYDAEMKRAQTLGQVELLKEFSQLSFITAKWALEGFPIDADQWMTIAETATEERDRLARELERMLLPEGYAQTMGMLAEAGPNEGTEEDERDEDDENSSVDSRKDAIIRISQVKLVTERLVAVLGERVTKLAFPRDTPSIGKDARSAWERAYRQAHNGETHPFFHTYERWKKVEKQVSTYGPRFLFNVHPLSGRVHPNFTIAGTDTGRYSSSSPNMLNLPSGKEDGDPDLRGAFTAPEGHYLLGADYSGMETRISGCLTRDPVLKALFDAGADSHAFTACLAFHLRRADVTETTEIEEDFKFGTETKKIKVLLLPQATTDAELALMAASAQGQKLPDKKSTRFIAKMISFLVAYRGTFWTLAARLGLPLAQAEDFFLRYNKVYSVLDAGMSELGRVIYKNATEGPDGRTYTWAGAYGGLRRWWILPENPSRRDYGPGWAGDCQFEAAQKDYKRQLKAREREAANCPAQGGNAVILAKALNGLVENGHRMGVYPFLSIYDEILTVAPDSVPPEVVKGLLEGEMQSAADEYMTYIPAEVEADVQKAGKKWVKS